MGLTKRFGKVVAVNNLNLDVSDKEFVALLGPSGCGKTTALRCIAGLEFADEGGIYIGDRLVNDLDPKDRDIAMVFQSYALYPHMTVHDNIAFPLKMRGMSKADVDKRVKEVAELLRIEMLLDRRPKQLSGGQQQRVALGRALVREPKVFLMDEPLSNLDAKLRVYMRAELKRLQKDIGVTTVYVTHDQVEAMTMADRVAIMNLGILQQFATPPEIYSKPSNVFVAGFIGSPPMNFFDCDFVEKDGGGYIDAGAFQFPLSKQLAQVVRNGGSSKLILGIRPRDITLHTDSSRSRGWQIKTTVYVVEPLGEEIIVNLKLGDQIIKASVSGEFNAQVSQEVAMSFAEGKIYLFDKATEKAII